jgi:hypothetical protein
MPVLDYFCFDVAPDNVVIAADDPGGIGKQIRSRACVKALACAARVCDCIKSLMQHGQRNGESDADANATDASSYVFLLCEMEKGSCWHSDKRNCGCGSCRQCAPVLLLDKPEVNTACYRLGDGHCQPDERQDLNAEFFQVLSDSTPMAECARAMICSNVLGFGGMKSATWQKKYITMLDHSERLLKALEDYGTESDCSRREYAHRWVLTVLVEVDVPRAVKKLRISPDLAAKTIGDS